MSVDERLRIGLSRNALSVTPDVDWLLESALARRRRAIRARWAGATAGIAAAACALAVVVLPGGIGRDRGAPTVPADATASVDVRGRYAGQVAALQTAPSVEGRWVLEFRDAGVLVVTAPPAYPGVVSGVLYAVEGDELRTDLFSQDRCSGLALGRYAVARTAAGLALTEVDDPCGPRVAVLARTTWAAAP
jgi:hypothetical protein